MNDEYIERVRLLMSNSFADQVVAEMFKTAYTFKLRNPFLSEDQILEKVIEHWKNDGTDAKHAAAAAQDALIEFKAEWKRIHDHEK